jgi:hypothetical protein
MFDSQKVCVFVCVFVRKHAHPHTMCNLRSSHWWLLMSTLFWDLMSYSLAEAYWGFRETYFLHLKVQRMSQVSKQQQLPSSPMNKVATCFTYSLNPEDVNSILLLNIGKYLSVTHIFILNAAYYLVTLLPYYMFQLYMTINRCLMSCWNCYTMSKLCTSCVRDIS